MVFAPKAVLLDIDGTIMTSGGAGRLALIRAAARLFDRSEDETSAQLAAIDFRGNTDAMILEELGQRLAVDVATQMESLTRAYLAALDPALAECRSEVLPGVKELIRALDSRPRTRCGLLTGNIREGARKKLARVSLDQLVDRPGGFADDGRRRQEIAAVAMERLAAVGVAPWATLVIGDTEHDVAAAHDVGAPAVAVATGWTPIEELERCGAQLVLGDLSDPAPVLRLLDAL